MSDAKNPKPSEAREANDIFDLQRLRIAPDFAEAVGVKKLVLTVPVNQSQLCPRDRGAGHNRRKAH